MRVSVCVRVDDCVGVRVVDLVCVGLCVNDLVPVAVPEGAWEGLRVAVPVIEGERDWERVPDAEDVIVRLCVLDLERDCVIVRELVREFVWVRVKLGVVVALVVPDLLPDAVAVTLAEELGVAVLLPDADAEPLTLAVIDCEGDADCEPDTDAL